MLGALTGALALSAPLEAKSQMAGSDASAVGCMEMGQPCDPLAAPSVPAPPPNPSLDTAHAKATVEALCVGCHDAKVVAGARKSRDGWWSTVQTMKQYGLQATDSQQAEILEYLVAHYSS